MKNCLPIRAAQSVGTASSLQVALGASLYILMLTESMT
jgi:hypothetical protein